MRVCVYVCACKNVFNRSKFRRVKNKNFRAFPLTISTRFLVSVSNNKKEIKRDIWEGYPNFRQTLHPILPSSSSPHPPSFSTVKLSEMVWLSRVILGTRSLSLTKEGQVVTWTGWKGLRYVTTDTCLDLHCIFTGKNLIPSYLSRFLR